MRDLHQVDDGWAAIGGTGLIYEKFQKFSRELSIVGARSAAGHTVFYPLSANSHGGGRSHPPLPPLFQVRLARRAPLCFLLGDESAPQCWVPSLQVLWCRGPI